MTETGNERVVQVFACPDKPLQFSLFQLQAVIYGYALLMLICYLFLPVRPFFATLASTCCSFAFIALGLVPRMKMAAISACISSAAACLVFAISEFLPDSELSLMLAGVTSILIISEWLAQKTSAFLHLVLISIGAIWGFLVAMGVAISINNQHVSVDWLAMTVGSAILPVGFLVLLLPSWFYGRYRRNRDKAAS